MSTAVTNPILEIHDLTVAYQRKPVLWSVDLGVPAGVLAGIIGPNGAGKSTLIKAVMGLIPISSGYIKLFNQDLNHVRQRISYVPQRESVDWDFPASVFDVVMMGRYGKLGLFARPKQSDKDLVHAALEKVGMSSYSGRQISQLSGGQQQRVFLARALAQDADLYFMDEPFAGVDVATETAIIGLLKELRESGKTVLVVHHDLQTVTDYFDWTIMLNMKLVANGPASEVFTQENLQECYGGKLTILSRLGNLIKNTHLPDRD